MQLHSMPAWIAAGLRLLRGGPARHWAKRTLAEEVARIADPRLRAQVRQWRAAGRWAVC